MGRWLEWELVADGPYQGTPALASMGMPDIVFRIDVQDRDGNVIMHIPAEPGFTGAVVNTGGADFLARTAYGHSRMGGFYALGQDQGLYLSGYDGQTYTWTKVTGPGRFLSEVFSLARHDGYGEVFGEGLEHQLAYAKMNPGQDRSAIMHWQNLGKPGEPGGKQGMNGRPAVIQGREGLHIFVRGQDNHLWHMAGKGDDLRQNRVFGEWANLGGGITQPPVVNPVQEGLECYVIGEQKELYVKSWDGKGWSDFQPLGGQLKGLPVPITLWSGNHDTYVFGRGAHDQLWYRQRTGAQWQPWQLLGDGLVSDVAVWEGMNVESGDGLISCLALRENGALWQRQLLIPAKEYRR